MIKNDGPKNATLKTGKTVKKPGKKPVPQAGTARYAVRMPLFERWPPTVGRWCRVIQYVAYGAGTCAIHGVERPPVRMESVVAPKNTAKGSPGNQNDRILRFRNGCSFSFSIVRYVMAMI